MTKKRKGASYGSPKVEVKEENVLGNDYLMAKGRLEGVLKQLTEKSESDSDSSDDNTGRNHRRSRRAPTPPRPIHHTYVMKLFDRSVDLARFEEDTPLYPICRAWMANQPRNPQTVIKRRRSAPEEDVNYWSGNFTEINRLPPPSEPYTTRVPSPLPEQQSHTKEGIDIIVHLNEKPPVARDVLIRNHLKRWSNVKKKWISTAQKNEMRYFRSTQILQAIYNKAQETME